MAESSKRQQSGNRKPGRPKGSTAGKKTTSPKGRKASGKKGYIMNVDTSTFTGENGEPLMYSWASNKTPAGEELEELIAERVEKIREAQPEKEGQPVPQDLVTCSGTGLDPAISPAAAEFQVSRIARERGITEDDVRAIIETYTDGRVLGVFGEPAVNVLKVNLALDGITWKE